MADNAKPPMKWYFKPFFVIIAVLSLGPFALPLVWMSPAFSKPSKIVITILVILLTIWLVRVSMDTYHLFMKEMQDLQNAVKLY